MKMMKTVTIRGIITVPNIQYVSNNCSQSIERYINDPI